MVQFTASILVAAMIVVPTLAAPLATVGLPSEDATQGERHALHSRARRATFSQITRGRTAPWSPVAPSPDIMVAMYTATSGISQPANQEADVFKAWDRPPTSPIPPSALGLIWRGANKRFIVLKMWGNWKVAGSASTSAARGREELGKLTGRD
ncbi:hypothetical protein NLJ89_g9795 [Agrocybe chaxingu]|uniref:Uncharacterized protein n=1 Tax=Agrocybe chaxingu TaxID=84603 RepID=A0A9W8JV90_9AGAR|nr:hypothetical protein NLJ89_g9795 [Agrocybe chaxingu]